MTVKKSFLRAAQAVLQRAGRPMHYTAIAKAAIRMDLLRTTVTYPEVVISSAISADISSNPQSPFRREKAGVFREKAGVFTLRTEALEIGSITDELSPKTIDKLHQLHEGMKWASDAEIVRKALYLLRRILDLSQGSSPVSIEGSIDSLSVDPQHPNAFLTAIGAQRLVGRQASATYQTRKPSTQREIALKVRQARSIVSAVETRTPIRGWDQTVLFALNILDAATSRAGEDGQIRLKGETAAATIQLFSDTRLARK
jgi:hypothetical protein